MATISITIPDAALARVIDAFANQYNYSAYLDEEETIPNPETAAQFAKRMIAEYAKNVLVAHEANAAADTARLDAIETAREVDIT